MSRKRHQTKEYEALFKRAERKDWEVTGGGNRHFKMKCPNGCKHLQVVSSTPGTRRDFLRTMTQLNNTTCWKED